MACAGEDSVWATLERYCASWDIGKLLLEDTVDMVEAWELALSCGTIGGSAEGGSAVARRAGGNDRHESMGIVMAMACKAIHVASDL